MFEKLFSTKFKVKDKEQNVEVVVKLIKNILVPLFSNFMKRDVIRV